MIFNSVNKKECSEYIKKKVYGHDGEMKNFNYNLEDQSVDTVIENSYTRERYKLHFSNIVFIYITNHLKWGFCSDYDCIRLTDFVMKENNDMFESIAKTRSIYENAIITEYKNMLNFVFQTFTGSEIYIVCDTIQIDVTAIEEVEIMLKSKWLRIKPKSKYKNGENNLVRFVDGTYIIDNKVKSALAKYSIKGIEIKEIENSDQVLFKLNITSICKKDFIFYEYGSTLVCPNSKSMNENIDVFKVRDDNGNLVYLISCHLFKLLYNNELTEFFDFDIVNVVYIENNNVIPYYE